MAEYSPVIGSLFRIHKIISRGLGISIRKCDEYLGKNEIPQEEAAGFTRYVTALKGVTHAHQQSEDKIAFTYFKDKIEAPYDRLRAEHRAISRILVELDRSIPGIASGEVGRLREVLGGFEKLWVPHIALEEGTFTAEKLRGFSDIKEQWDITEKLTRHGIKNSGVIPLTLPFMLFNIESADRKAFMIPIPWFVEKVLVPVMWKEQWKPMGPFLLP